MIHISLFSGIGGFELAAEWMGWRNYVSCDINEFGNKVRKHYWPEGYHHLDIHTLTYETINTELTKRFGNYWRNDDIIITGGFPCQPYSNAGKRLGNYDERHLFPQMLRVISEVKPTFIVGENVYGLVNWNEGVVFEEVCADLERIGYKVQPVLLSASGIGAPHQRMRVFFVAHTNGNGLNGRDCENEVNASEGGEYALGNIKQMGRDAADTDNEGSQGGRGEWCRFESVSRNRNWEQFPTQSPIYCGDDGIPSQLDGITFSKWRQQSIMAYGNAVVPQLVYAIFQSLNYYNKKK